MADNPYGNSAGQMSGSVQFGGNGAASPAAIKDTTTAGFARDVLEESRHQPVLVDFWAPWCEPCKQLTPIIEKLVNESQGRVKLVKMNIDDHPSIPGQLGIQSIPAVIAFVSGRPVDGFMGAVPESQIKQFIDKIAGPPGANRAAEVAAMLDQADKLLIGHDAEGAAELYGAILQAEPENLKALAGMARSMIAAGQSEGAQELISQLSDEEKADPAIVAVAKQLEQIEEARKFGDPRVFEHELALNPDDHSVRMKLAKVLNVQGDRAGAADHLLYIMKRDRAFEDDGARRQLVEFFDAWGLKDPVTTQSRRKLSSILFS